VVVLGAAPFLKTSALPLCCRFRHRREQFACLFSVRPGPPSSSYIIFPYRCADSATYPRAPPFFSRPIGAFFLPLGRGQRVIERSCFPGGFYLRPSIVFRGGILPLVRGEHPFFFFFLFLFVDADLSFFFFFERSVDEPRANVLREGSLAMTSPSP